MKGQVLERRLELLKLEGNGLSSPEMVKDLSIKYRVSERSIYYDLETKTLWQPVFQETKNAYLKMINRHEQLYRKAMLIYVQAKSTRERIFAIHLMRAINKDMFDFLPRADRMVVHSQKTKADARINDALKEYNAALKKAATENIQATNQARTVMSDNALQETVKTGYDC